METAVDSTLLAVDDYGSDRLEDTAENESDDAWLIEATESTDRTAVEHLLDTIAFSDWHFYSSFTDIISNPGNVLPLHLRQDVQLLRPSDASFPVFSADLGNYVGYREYQWENDLPNLKTICDEQQSLIILLDSQSALSPSENTNMLLHLAANQPTVIVFFGDQLPEFLQHISLPVLHAPDDSKTAQAMAVQVIFGGQEVSIAGRTGMDALILGHAPPEAVGIKREKLADIERYVRRAIRRKAIPGCQVLVAKSGKIIYDKTFGYHTYEKELPVQPQDVYDLASLTKAAATTLAMMQLYDESRIDLAMRVKDYLPEYNSTGLRYLRLRHLLAHHTGLQANLPIAHWLRQDDLFQQSSSASHLTAVSRDLYLKNGVSDGLLEELKEVRTARRPFYRYSDVNFILLQQLIERLGGLPLDQYLDRYIYDRMGLRQLQFKPGLAMSEQQIVPTERDRKWRRQLVQGEVHDESALLLGGVAGHAGLFSNARDLAALFQMLLNEGHYGGDQFFQTGTVAQFIKRNGYNYRAFGFDRLAGHSKKLLRYGASKATFGHTGFTGTCVWADPENDLIFIFLSNRIHPNKYNNRLQKMGLRERIHKIVYKSLDTYKEEV